jgi:two-component system, response regulator PdtaR
MARVLVVEDDAWIRLWLEDVLEDAGHAVTSCHTADQAITVLERDDDFDVLLTDINMPGERDGLGLASTARAMYPHLRVVVSSGKRQPTASELPTRSNFLMKPYLSDAMLPLIQPRYCH